jgi:hypothetical protein
MWHLAHLRSEEELYTFSKPTLAAEAKAIDRIQREQTHGSIGGGFRHRPERKRGWGDVVDDDDDEDDDDVLLGRGAGLQALEIEAARDGR